MQAGKKEWKLAETEKLLLDLGAEHNVEEKGENEAVSENLNDVVVELEDKIDKEKVMKVFVIKSEPKAELEADLDSQEKTTTSLTGDMSTMTGLYFKKHHINISQ